MRLFCIMLTAAASISTLAQTSAKRCLYVATPGIRDYLGYGGHGVLVFDINKNHRFVKRIPTKGFHPDGKPSNVKGIAVSVALNSLYVSTIEGLQRIDLATDKLVWEKEFEGGCDRMSVSPDGKTMYLPSMEKDFWNVVDCETGNIVSKIQVVKRAHNTLYGSSGNRVYMADIASPLLFVADAKKHSIVEKVGPFANFVRPFTVNRAETRVYVTVDSLLGFEVGDLTTGKLLSHVVVEGWNTGPVRRHGNPSHGIGLTPDEKELWVADGYNMRMHIFSATPPYQQLTTIPLQDMPGWITFSLDGKYAYPSSGEVIDVRTRKILCTLQDEHHNSVASEKMIEIQFNGNKAVHIADQFGVGRVVEKNRLPGEQVNKVSRIAAPPQQSASIHWDTATLQRISPAGMASFYPRMLQLADGSLLTVYASGGNIMGTGSSDGGKSWSLPAVIAPREEGVNQDTPDLLQLQNGSLLLCYATRPQGALRGAPDTAKKFEILVLQSGNGGKTWQGKKLYKAGSSFKDGCWEPSMVQLPGGEIQLFFADEGVYTRSDEQNISLLRSSDNGATWSETPQIISFRKGSRDGMPVPVWLRGENKVVMAIEDPGHKNFKPYTIRSAPQGRWQKTVDGSDPARSYALATPIEDSVYAGAPYLRQLSTGETILSYQSTEGRAGNKDNNAVMRVAIGDKEAKAFSNVSTPFAVPEGHHALWSSLCVLKNDVVVAVTSTNAFSQGRPEIWMIKGSVKHQQ